MTKYLYVLLTILFTTYGQLVIKWRLNKLSELPGDLLTRVTFLTKTIMTDFYILSGFIAAYIAALCWMMAIKKLQLNVAYPLMSISFVLVFLLSTFLFGEKASIIQVFGLLLILTGVSVVGFSMRSTL